MEVVAVGGGIRLLDLLPLRSVAVQFIVAVVDDNAVRDSHLLQIPVGTIFVRDRVAFGIFSRNQVAQSAEGESARLSIRVDMQFGIPAFQS